MQRVKIWLDGWVMQLFVQTTGKYPFHPMTIKLIWMQIM